MVILGAKGLAKELLAALQWNGEATGVFLFDDISKDTPDCLYGKFPIIKTWQDLEAHFTSKPDFALGVGGHKAKMSLSHKATMLGGKLCSIISGHALIGSFGVNVAPGVCILSLATITADVEIGEGSLINKAAIISHDVVIGSYCEISPGAKILGRARIGDRTEVGTNAVILPNVVVGSDCRVGAGAVVTKNVPNGCTVKGIPAKALL